ncbi:MAG: nucleotide sugar dehydrogenase [Chitinophagaceae bacterium]|nr:nucleotide sugar dehydrogenase [Chitinophagaceae bacterium]
MDKYSKDGITNELYEIPANADDKAGIDAFLAMHPGKKVIVVQGLGFVGAVMSLVCANALTEEYAVIGIDLLSKHSFWKIRSINAGRFPITASDPQIEIFYRNALAKGNLYATYDPYCFSKADVVIVDINLDVAKVSTGANDLGSYDVSLENFKKAIASIGDQCKEDILILVETTVPPGTCQHVVRPIIDDCLAKRGAGSQRYYLGHSYERVMPGPDYIDSIQNFYRVYSGIDDQSADRTEQFLKTIISSEKYPLTRLGNTTATEMSKVLENSYRAMNIAFMVEWSRFAEEAGVNIYEVVDAIRMRPTHKNLMYPGIGVGGYCLTKDPLLASWARQNLFMSPHSLAQSETGVRINDKMPYYAFEFLNREYGGSLKDRKLLMLGVSYRSNVADTRYSPVEYLYDYLLDAGARISLHDPYVSFWEEKQMPINQDLDSFFSENWDIIIISTGHVEYKNNKQLIQRLLDLKETFILDTIGLLDNNEICELQQKHRVRVIGRGDIK